MLVDGRPAGRLRRRARARAPSASPPSARAWAPGPAGSWPRGLRSSPWDATRPRPGASPACSQAVGMDDVRGVLAEGIAGWRGAGLGTASTPVVEVERPGPGPRPGRGGPRGRARPGRVGRLPRGGGGAPAAAHHHHGRARGARPGPPRRRWRAPPESAAPWRRASSPGWATPMCAAWRTAASRSWWPSGPDPPARPRPPRRDPSRRDTCHLDEPGGTMSTTDQLARQRASATPRTSTRAICRCRPRGRSRSSPAWTRG